MNTVVVKQFCSVLKDFLGDMYKSYPDNSLLTLITATNAMVLVNPNGVLKNFICCIDPYVEKILCRDESFFLDGGLSKDLSDIDGNYSFLKDELNKVVNIWNNPSTTLKTKNAIWRYFEVLTKLSMKAVGR